MYEEEFAIGSINKGKKANEIDNDGPVSKKDKKNKMKKQRKNQTQQNLLQERETKKQQEQEVISEKKKLKKQQQKVLNNVKGICSSHKQETIIAVLERNAYNQADALDELFQMDEDMQEKKIFQEPLNTNFQPPPQNSTSLKENGNNLLEEMFSNEVEIEKSEFETLFDEIANIIKEDQRKRGVDLLEINDFVDDCNSIKKVLILQHEEDISLNEDDPLIKQTQEFLEQIIKVKVVEQKKKETLFPTLNSIEKSEKKGKNFIQKIQDDYKEQRSREELFVKSKVPMQYSQPIREQPSIFNFANEEAASQVIEQLSKNFKGMSIEKIKFIYDQLRDLNLCKDFLMRYYPETKTVSHKVQNISPQKKSVKKIIKQESKGGYKGGFISEELRGWSIGELREQLDHLYKIKQVFKMTRGKTTNIDHRKNLQRLACRDDTKIERLREANKYRTVSEMAESHPQDLDLHGYREEQIFPLLDEISKMLQQEFKAGNSLLQTKKINGEILIVVRLGTGKGLHSRSGKSVLKPAILEWCERLDTKAVKGEDYIDVYIRL